MGNGIGGRIVGGQDADEGEYPWQVSWRRVEGDGAYHSCGGSVLNEDFVLTAGPQSKYNREFLSPISNGFSFLGSKGGMGKFSSILLKRQGRTKWRNCRLSTKTPDYQLGWAIWAASRLLDTLKLNFCFMQ